MLRRMITLVFTLTVLVQGLVSAEDKVNRIAKLLPNLETPLNIEPYIPDNFELVQPIEELESRQFLWLPKGEFEKYLKDPNSQKGPYIQVLKQNGPVSKDFEKSILSELKGYFPENFSSSKLNWGPYEVISLRFAPTYDIEYQAIVDLKSKNGDYLIFMLMYKKTKGFGNGNVPSEEDLKFWNDFLYKTRAL